MSRRGSPRRRARRGVHPASEDVQEDGGVEGDLHFGRGPRSSSMISSTGWLAEVEVAPSAVDRVIPGPPLADDGDVPLGLEPFEV